MVTIAQEKSIFQWDQVKSRWNLIVRIPKLVTKTSVKDDMTALDQLFQQYLTSLEDGITTYSLQVFPLD